MSLPRHHEHDADSVRGRRSEQAILLLYLFFFVFWSVGLVIGLWPGAGRNILPSDLWGLPLWFVTGGMAAYGVACVALVWVVRRYFR